MSKRLRSVGTTVVAWAAAVLFGGVGIPSLFAVWDKTKPANNSLAVSSDIRANWDALESAVGGVNLVADPTFLVWQAGDTTAPAHWVTAGTSHAVARTGTGLGDTVTKVGPFSLKLTSGGAAIATAEQAILPAAQFDTSLRLRYVSCGAWVRTASAAAVRTYIDAGAGGKQYSTTHAGGSVFSWMTETFQLNASASLISFGVENAAGTIASYLSGPSCVIGQIPPQDYIPAPVRYEQEVVTVQTGNLSTGTDKARFHPQRPGIIREVFCDVKTPPTTQSVIVDVNTWDGAAFTSMFTTRPTITAGNRRGSGQPDTTYARRCFTGMFKTGATAAVAGELIAFDIDQVGSGTVGADLTCGIRYLTYLRPLEAYLAFNTP